MIAASQFIEHIRGIGYSQYCGVPCSFLKPFINYVIDDPSLDYIGAASEGEAVGINLGASLAGAKTRTTLNSSRAIVFETRRMDIFRIVQSPHRASGRVMPRPLGSLCHDSFGESLAFAPKQTKQRWFNSG